METITYQGKIIEVVEKKVDVNGKEKTFEFARRSPGVRLIVPTEGGIILSKEFRHELNGFDYRLPGGKVFDTLNEYNAFLKSEADMVETAKIAAIKEAKEEMGIIVRDLTFFHKSVCGATVVWDLFYFVVNEFEKETQELEEGEDITTEIVTLEKAREMCLNDMSEERSALILLRYLTI
jgi:8-oxo-dGTP pyrophosphatase MutT (NUDIX family)